MGGGCSRLSSERRGGKREREKKKFQRLYIGGNTGGSTHGGHMVMKEKRGNVGLHLYNALAVGT